MIRNLSSIRALYLFSLYANEDYYAEITLVKSLSLSHTPRTYLVSVFDKLLGKSI